MKHLDTAERLHFFLAQQKLSRERFLQEIQNAITRSSLLSLLNGHRRPARTFALLLEWKWGFRADYLLHGKGDAWTSAGSGKSGLSPLEQDVVSFMRESPVNAQEMQTALDKAALWQRLFERTEQVLAQLGAVDTQDYRYPAMATLTLEECWRLADRHRHYGELIQARRVLKLTLRFLQRFVVPAAPDESALGGLLPPLERRLRETEANLRAVRAGLDYPAQGAPWPDGLTDAPEDDGLSLLADLTTWLATHAEALGAAGVPVAPLLARVDTQRRVMDAGAWGAELAVRTARVGLVPTAAPERSAGALRRDYRRLLATLSTVTPSADA
jgi:hypothetical protein